MIIKAARGTRTPILVVTGHLHFQLCFDGMNAPTQSRTEILSVNSQALYLQSFKGIEIASFKAFGQNVVVEIIGDFWINNY